MALPDGNANDYRQKQFTQAYESAEKAFTSLKRRSAVRRGAAYFLKGVAVFGGLAVTYGLPGELTKLVGLAISACVAVDAWLSNHKRLLGITEASYAYDRILADARNRHARELGPILDLKEIADPAAIQRLGQLLQSLIEDLQREVRIVQAALVRLDIDALRNLSPEQSEGSRPTGGT